MVQDNEKRGVEFLFALQLKKGLKKGEVTYIATLKEEEMLHEVPLPLEEEVLDEYKDIMPKELPKRLPPRREVDHKIELVPRAKPSAMAPY